MWLVGVASGCGEQEAGVASGSGWNLWVCAATFCSLKKNVFRSLILHYLFILGEGVAKSDIQTGSHLMRVFHMLWNV